MIFPFDLAYIKPFVEEIRPVSEFVLKSQWKYQVPFEFSNKQVSFENSEVFYKIFINFPNLFRFQMLKTVQTFTMHCPKKIFHILLHRLKANWAHQYWRIQQFI